METETKMAMQDVASALTSVELEDAIKAKIKLKVSDQRIHRLIDDTALLHDFEFSDQLKVLKSATESSVGMVEEMGEGSGLKCCDLGVNSDDFALLDNLTKRKFYIREGYAALLNEMNRLWQESKRRLVLLGNSGTGKSWYQIFILRQLLIGENNPIGFEFVVRQVGPEIFLIDLDDGNAYGWFPNNLKWPMKKIIDMLEATLYMYEPKFVKEVPPMDLVHIPSLATLSPFGRRIEEYQKSHLYKELYFWPWSFSEMNAVAHDSNLGLSENDILKHHLYFGGIVRLVLNPDFEYFFNQLEARLANVSMKVLLNKHHDIDRDVSGNSVSGCILCYDGFRRGQNVFDKKVIAYTSAFVKTKVDDIMSTRPLKEKVETVLRRLNDEIVDLSANNLEAVGSELLSRGNDIKWLAKRIGGRGNWSSFVTTKREVTRLWDVGERLRQRGRILVSVNTNFPLADIVFSQPMKNDAHDVIQFTWQESNPFTVRALFDLRVRRLQVPDTVVVNVYVVYPEKEKDYQTINEDTFLIGRLDVPFKWSKNSVVKAPAELQTMWYNTNLYVLKPELTWKTLLGNVLHEL